MNFRIIIAGDYLGHDHTVSDNGHVPYASKTIGMKLNIIVIKDFTTRVVLVLLSVLSMILLQLMN